MARAASLPRGWITKDGLVVDKEIGQSIVGIKLVLTGTTIVANVLVGSAVGKTCRVAGSIRAIVQEAFVPFGKESIKLGRDFRARRHEEQSKGAEEEARKVGRHGESMERRRVKRQFWKSLWQQNQVSLVQ